MNLLIALEKTENRRPNYPSAIFAEIMKPGGLALKPEKNGWQVSRGARLASLAAGEEGS